MATTEEIVRRRARRRAVPDAATRAAKASEVVLSSLCIKGFRGIRELRIRDLAPISIFTGRNGCGKTSVLEAAFLLSGLSNANLVFSLAAFRGIGAPPASDLPFRVLFGNADPEATIVLQGELGYGRPRPTLELRISSITSPAAGGATTDAGTRLSGLEFRANSGSGEKIGKISWDALRAGVGSATLEIGPIRLEAGPSLKPEIPPNPDIVPARFVRPQPHFTLAEIYAPLTELVIRRALDEVVSLVRLAIPEVVSVQPLMERGQPMVFVDVGLPNLIPAQMLGGGSVNLLQLATYIADGSARLLLVDEIEDGLHYSVLPSLAEMMLKIARERRIQFLITTHSRDVVRAFAEASAASADDTAFFKLFRREGRHEVARFSVEDVAVMEEVGTEVR